MCTVWSGLSCYQAHTADNSKITHSHTHILLHVNINCSRELPNYKEVTLPRWFFKSVLYGDISFILFCNSRKLLRADIPSASYFMLIWKNAVLFWHHTLTEQMFFVGVVYISETQLYAVAFLNTLLSESILDMFTVPAMQIVQYTMCSFSTSLSFLELKLYAVTYKFLHFHYH